MPLDSGAAATAFLRDLGDVTPGTSDGAPDVTNNAHIHLPPNFSAFESVAQAVGLAAGQGVRVLGASNYYDYSVYRGLAAESARRGVFPIFGLEIIALDGDLQRAGVKVNDPGNPGKYYLCGKAIARFDPLEGEAAALLGAIRDADSARMSAMVEKLAGLLAAQGVESGLDAAAIRAAIARRHGCAVETVFLQERHVAQAFQESLFSAAGDAGQRGALLERLFGAPSKNPADPATVQGEIRSHLMKAGKPGYAEETFVDFGHAYRLVLALGGIPCYPTLADGASPVCAYEESPEALIADLRARGVFAAEFIPVRNSPEVLSRYVHALRAAGLVVTAGTEHNTPDLIPLRPAALKGQPIPADVQAIFDEGACVLAAHQYLVANGRPGFVDAQGRPNAEYTTDGERISAFARLGRAVLAEYQG